MAGTFLHYSGRAAFLTLGVVALIGLAGYGGCGPTPPVDNGNDNGGNGPTPPADGETRIYGRVLDAAEDTPLAEARITVAGVDGEVGTNADGYFAFPVASGGTYAVTARKSGYTYAQRRAFIQDGGLRAVEDMYLTPLDGRAIVIGRAGGVGVNSDGSIELNVPAGAMRATTEMRATWYEEGKHLPNFLPELSHFTYACELTPNGQTFDEPVTIRMRNTRGFPPGTPIPVGVYNPDTLAWEHESMAEVSADGEWVVYGVEHFSPRDINLPFEAPYGASGPGSAGEVGEEDCPCRRNRSKKGCNRVRSGSYVYVGDGHLSVDHLLPGYWSLEQERTVALEYHSPPASPAVPLQLRYDPTVGSVIMPDRIRFVASIGGHRLERFFEPAAGPMVFSYLWDGTDALGDELPDGIYDYELTLANEYEVTYGIAEEFGGELLEDLGILADEMISMPSVFTGTVELRREAPAAGSYGHGFAIADEYQLNDENGDQVEIDCGDGTTCKFSSSASGEEPITPGDFSDLTRNPDGTFLWTLPDQTQITFDEDGRRTTEADAFGNTTTHTYDADGRLSTITDPVGKVTTFAYDAAGHFSSITDPAGRVIRFEVDAAGDLVRITNPDGTTRRFVYDNDHRMTRQIDAGGNVTSYTYNERGAVVRVDRADGTHTEHVSARDAGLINDLPANWGTEDHPVPASETTDRLPSYTDPSGGRYVFEVNGYGTRTAITDPLGLTINMERNADDLLTVLRMPGGKFQAYGYDDRGRPVSISGAGTGGGGRDLLRITYDDGLNLPLTVTDDAVGTWENAYGPEGNISSATLPDGRVYTFTHNQRGQRTSMTIAGQTTTYAFDGDANLASITDPGGGAWSFTYDAYGNLAGVTDPDGRTEAVTYNLMNLPERFVNGAGNEVRFTYAPAAGSLDGEGLGPVAVVTAITDGRGNTTTFTYDEMYNIVRTADPLGNETTVEHDPVGRITAIIEPTGARVDYSYDGAGNLTAKTLSTGETYAYTYNSETGLLETITAPTCQTTHVYDGFERLSNASTTFLPGGLTGVLDYAYRSSIYGGETVTFYVGEDYNDFGFEYDPGHPLLPSDLFGGTWFWLELEYDGAGRLSGWEEFYNSLDAQFTYDAADRLTAAGFADYDGATAFSAAWDYSPAGYLISMTFAEGTHTFGYDGAGRLTAAIHPVPDNPPEHYSYDAAGNRRVAGSETGFVYDGANRLISDPDYTYAYDASGNLILKTELSTNAQTHYAYDAENRLKAVTRSDGTTIAYAYDAIGRRVEKTVDGAVRHYLFDRDEEIAEFHNGVLVTQWVNGLQLDAPVGVKVGDFWDYDNYFYYSDPLGTPRAVADEYGYLLSTCRYRSFGEPVDAATPVDGGRLFAGRAYDEETGLYYLRERFYDPHTGLFLQRDPLPIPAAVAPYVYAANSPTNARDPFGLSSDGGGALRGLIQEQAVEPAKGTAISEGISRIPIVGKAGSAAYGQYSQWSDVIRIYGSKNAPEGGIKWLKSRWWNPAGKYTESFITLGGRMPRRTAKLQKICGLRSGLRNFFQR